MTERPSVTTQDLLEQTLVGISPATSMMKQLRKAATALGRELCMTYRVNTIEAARALVKAGLGATILPESMLPKEDFDRVAIVPLDEPCRIDPASLGRRCDDARALMLSSRLSYNRLESM